MTTLFIILCMTPMALGFYMNRLHQPLRTWWRGRHVRRQERIRKRAYHRVGSMKVSVQEGWFGNYGAPTMELVILMENGYGRRKFIGNDVVSDFPPLRYWLEGATFEDTRRMFKSTSLFAV